MSRSGPTAHAGCSLARALRRAARTMALTLGAVLTVGLISALTPGSSPTLTPIGAGNLVWGFDQTFRQLAGPGALGQGVSQNPAGAYVWPVTGGSYDEAQRATTLSFAGRVHWLAQLDPATGRHRIDVAFANPQLRIAAAGSELTADVEWVDPAGQRLTRRVPLANLNVAGLFPVVAGGITRWPGIPTELTRSAAEEVLGGLYPAGRLLDPVDVSYPGPGGAPDSSEGFGQPGQARFERTANRLYPWTGHGASWIEPMFVDARLGVVHAQVDIPGSGVRLQSFETATGRFGEPGPAVPAERVLFADPANQRVYYRSTPDGPMDSYLQWDAVTGRWAAQPLATSIVLRGRVYRTLWDAERRRLYTFDREVPPGVDLTAHDAHLWHLNTYTETAPGQFVESRQRLANGPAGRNSDWYADVGAVASDGSILLRPNPAVHSPLLRQIAPDGAAVVREIPGTEQLLFSELIVGANGYAALLVRGNLAGPTTVQTLRVLPGGVVQLLGPRADLARMDVQAGAFDPTDGTLWLQARSEKRLILLREGRVVGDRADPLLNERGAFVWVGPDRAAHVLSGEGRPFGADGDRYRYGFATFRSTGVLPSIVAPVLPAAPQVNLSRPDDVARVTLTVGNAAEPGTTLRWQSRRAGEAQFTDLVGATAPTVSGEVRAADHRTQYRAVFTNPAGSVATVPVTLAVSFAPRITFQPLPAAVAPGQNAQFPVQSTGSPESVVGWQRQSGGQWEDLVADGTGRGNGFGVLTVVAPTPQMDGTRYRARVVNPLGVAFSDEVTLTVRAVPASAPAPGGGDRILGPSLLPPGALVMPIAAGEFVWLIDGDRTAEFQPVAGLDGYLQAIGEIDPVLVTDTRTGGPRWSLSGRMGPFTGGLSGGYLGWTPQILAEGAGALRGPPVDPGFPSGNGLSVDSVLASADPGHAPGTARVGASLLLRLPANTAPGAYTATLTITAVS